MEEEDGEERWGQGAKKVKRAERGEERKFTSFYDKPYLRQQALSGWRKSGRTQTAFGVAVPSWAEREYVLPAWVMKEEEV